MSLSNYNFLTLVEKYEDSDQPVLFCTRALTANQLRCIFELHNTVIGKVSELTKEKADIYSKDAIYLTRQQEHELFIKLLRKLLLQWEIWYLF